MKISKEFLAGGALAASLVAGCSADQAPLPEGVLQFQTFEEVNDDGNLRSFTRVNCTDEDSRYHSGILRDQAPGYEPPFGAEDGPSRAGDLHIAASSHEGDPYGVIVEKLGGSAAVYVVATSESQYDIFNLDDGPYSLTVEKVTPDHNLGFNAELVEDDFGGYDAVFTTSCEPAS